MHLVAAHSSVNARLLPSTRFSSSGVNRPLMFIYILLLLIVESCALPAAFMVWFLNFWSFLFSFKMALLTQLFFEHKLSEKLRSAALKRPLVDTLPPWSSWEEFAAETDNNLINQEHVICVVCKSVVLSISKQIRPLWIVWVLLIEKSHFNTIMSSHRRSPKYINRGMSGSCLMKSC